MTLVFFQAVKLEMNRHEWPPGAFHECPKSFYAILCYEENFYFLVSQLTWNNEKNKQANKTSICFLEQVTYIYINESALSFKVC